LGEEDAGVRGVAAGVGEGTTEVGRRMPRWGRALWPAREGAGGVCCGEKQTAAGHGRIERRDIEKQAHTMEMSRVVQKEKKKIRHVIEKSGVG